MLPSMSMAVKSHQAFFWATRTVRVAGLLPLLRRIPAVLPSILSPPPPSPHPWLGEGGGGERMLRTFADTRRTGPRGGDKSDSGRLVCASVRAPGPNNRLSVGDLPRSPAPVTVYASSVRHTTSQSPPIERTVPSQDHPAAQRRLSPTPLASLPRRQRPRILSSLVRVCPRQATAPYASAAAAAAFACRRAVESTRNRQSFS